jgi:cyclopropane fatty-acyl-phospholipid synthase-like methyltransferase
MQVLERNSIIYLGIISTSVLLAVFVHPLLLLLWLVILLADDVAYFAFGISLFDTEIAIQRGYQFGDVFLNNISGDGRDLGFNFYDGDLTKTREQAQQDKWDFVFDKLQLKPGDRLLDIGCGYGDWLNYARSKGVEVMGVNLSPDQAKYAQEHYNLNILNINWKDIPNDPALREQLMGQFDAVTFMDTIEHYVPSLYRHDKEKINRIYSDMFEMAHGLLKPNSHSQRVFISCLHMIRGQQGIADSFACYLQTRFHSGYYPSQDDGLTKNATPYFTELERFDRTEDYRLTSVLDSDHFGSPKIEWTLRRILSIPVLFLLDPHHIHKWMEIKTDAWMWHFGKDAFNPKYDNDHQKPLRHVTLWWLVLERRS